MQRPITQNIPAGLVDGRTEFFSHGTEEYCLTNGRVFKFREYPAEINDFLHKDMAENEQAVEALIELGIEGPEQMVRQYQRCMFGGFDGTADIDENGKLIHTEYWDCGMRGVCKAEGRLCSSVKAPNGILTPREIQVGKLVAEDLIDKEIAERLGISPTTVPVHIRHICDKIGNGCRKVGIARFFVQRNIINSK